MREDNSLDLKPVDAGDSLTAEQGSELRAVAKPVAKAKRRHPTGGT